MMMTMQGIFKVLALFVSMRAVGVDGECGMICLNSTRCTQSLKTCYYNVDGFQIIAEFSTSDVFHFNCNNSSISVNNTALPVSKKLTEVNNVTIRDCYVPSNGSYHDALKAMNITMLNNSILHLILRNDSKLEGHHLRDLPISSLHIEAQGESPLLAGSYLNYVSGLHNLHLTNVIQEESESEVFPVGLEKLYLQNSTITRRAHGSAWLDQLQSLSSLQMEREYSNEVPFALPKLHSLPKLKEIILSYVPLDPATLAGSLNGSAINTLKLTSCGLNNLSSEMFIGANITELLLNDNKLTVPKGLFSGLQWLTTLDLSRNDLDGKTLLDMVSPLMRLKTLIASENPLGSLCGDPDHISAKFECLPKSLLKLELRKTQATRICADWIENNALSKINLQNNVIHDLDYRDLMRRKKSGNLTINLENNSNVRLNGISRADVQRYHNNTFLTKDANNGEANCDKRGQVKVKLNSLTCDCETRYWLREAERSCPFLELNGVKECSDVQPHGPIANTLLANNTKEIHCPYNGSCLPECSCWDRPRDNALVVECGSGLFHEQKWSSFKNNRSLVLLVAPGTLTSVPARLMELHAPRNNITNLDEGDIPDTLRVLNVTHNRIQQISDAAVRKLRDLETKVYLAGNQLACACSDAPAFRLLEPVVKDWSETHCADESKNKTKTDLCPSLGLPLFILITMGLVVFTIFLLMLRYKVKVRQILFKLNLCRRYIFTVNDTDDSDKKVDAFLSYAYTDYEILYELQSGLEARGYSTIEHCRDWQTGLAISEQITRSVISARRTILLVSDNYAKSKWALKEFHAAHAHAMDRQTARVLIVRWNLNEPERLPSDLRLYLKYNTYLDWNDDKFWDKLCQYMPPLRFELSRRQE